MILRRVSWLLAVWLLVVNIVGLPAASAAIIGTKEEISIGRDVAAQMEKKYGVVDDPALQERINRIGMSLVAVCDRKDVPYSFKVLNAKDVNAVALPGGFVYVFKGLIDLMPSDDELAGVIGHEIGHVVKRHTVRQIEKSLGMNILFGVLFGDRGALLQNIAANAIMAGYSRDDERQADYLGYQHSLRAGYNPYSMLLGLYKLSELDQNSHYDLFSDHPEGRARVALMQKYLRQDAIKPEVAQVDDDKAAQIVDGEWKLPVIGAAYASYKPLYRAYFTAGVLYRLAKLPDYSGDKYILDSDGTNATIYYDDRQVLTVTPEDANYHGQAVNDLAGMYIDKLKQWQPKR